MEILESVHNHMNTIFMFYKNWLFDFFFFWQIRWGAVGEACKEYKSGQRNSE